MKDIHYFVAVVSLFLCSCYSYVVFPERYRDLPDSTRQLSAFVINPQLEREFRVMRSSGIFRFVSDSSYPVKIHLHEMDASTACGNSVSPFSELTLGLIPMYAPDRYYYSFDEISGTDTTHRRFELKVARRVSLYEIFRTQKDLDLKLAQALKGEYRDVAK